MFIQLLLVENTSNCDIIIRMTEMHYCVLYTPVMKQTRVREVLRRMLPGGKGIVFYPCFENWRRDTGSIEIKAMFPGYIL